MKDDQKCIYCGSPFDPDVSLSQALKSMLGVYKDQKKCYNVGDEELLATIIQSAIDKHEQTEEDLKERAKEMANIKYTCSKKECTIACERKQPHKHYPGAVEVIGCSIANAPMCVPIIEDAKADLLMEQIEEETDQEERKANEYARRFGDAPTKEDL